MQEASSEYLEILVVKQWVSGVSGSKQWVSGGVGGKHWESGGEGKQYCICRRI